MRILLSATSVATLSPWGISLRISRETRTLTVSLKRKSIRWSLHSVLVARIMWIIALSAFNQLVYSIHTHSYSKISSSYQGLNLQWQREWFRMIMMGSSKRYRLGGSLTIGCYGARLVGMEGMQCTYRIGFRRIRSAPLVSVHAIANSKIDYLIS